jgi:hypothetical protein
VDDKCEVLGLARLGLKFVPHEELHV